MSWMFSPGCACCGHDIIIMYWTDEDSFYSKCVVSGGSAANCDQYDSDKTNWNNFLQQHGGLDIRCGLMIPYSGSTCGCISANAIDCVTCEKHSLPEQWPNNVEITTCLRQPTPPVLQDFIDFFDYVRDGVFFPYVGVIVDNSGSMTTADIEPAYGAFLVWLQNTYGATAVLERTPSGERWIYQLQNLTEELIYAEE